MEEFLRSTPPGKVQDIPVMYSAGDYQIHYLLTPDVLIYCDNAKCQGERFYTFTEKSPSIVKPNEYQLIYLRYRCRNCGESPKLFSLMHLWNGTDLGGKVYKFGEYPVYGPQTPSRVISLIGPDKDLFLCGRRCESQGLGIGAYTYYRRVVENQWSRLIDSVIKVADRIGAQKSIIEGLEKTKTENQFSKSLVENKDIIPQSLLVEGHNPLFLLHSALSSGLHAKSDAECLELAIHIRIVLTELADRIGQALKDHSGLKTAVSRLLQAHKDKRGS